MICKFPFGAELKKVEQQDKNPKEVFVLGVYASAVHAKWLSTNEKMKVRALAVASEPCIFWKGENVEEEINKIKIPKELGKLIPADKRFNGPSGVTLDKLFLAPLGYKRSEVWLCDLLPYSRLNSNQQNAIEKHYTNQIVKEYNLPECTIPKFSTRELNNESRREEILEELKHSHAETLVLLGDLPISKFLAHFTNKKYTKLSDFGETPEEYGRAHPIEINKNIYRVIPLVHPRQAGNLGKANFKWIELHKNWIKHYQ
jgi:uracil-DNA glycosylase